MRRALVSLSTFVFVFVVATSLIAQIGYKLKTRSAAEMAAEQRRVVSAWCRMDFDGQRLSASTWQQKMKPLTTEKTYSDFPGFIIVSRYQFEPQETISTAVTVTYFTTGRYDLTFGYQPNSGQDFVTFRAEDKSGDVLITDTGSPLPHVSKAAAIRWMREHIESAKTPAEKSQLEDALKKLEPAPAQ